MTQNFYDISRTLSAAAYTWPGLERTELNEVLSQSVGDSVNVGLLSIGIHTGTHVDAPYHFDSTGETVDRLPLEIFWGPAQVVTITKKKGALYPEDLAEVDLGLAPRLLLHTAASELPEHIFPEEIAYPSPALAAHLAQTGVILFGTDAPSVDAVTDRLLPGHRALYKYGISILEGLDLSGVPDGLYELSALPLKVKTGDGSPVRAGLRRL